MDSLNNYTGPTGGTPPISPMLGVHSAAPVIPKIYWDTYDDEQRLKLLWSCFGDMAEKFNQLSYYYVPDFQGTWDATKQYPPLTVVSAPDGLEPDIIAGDSYTAIKWVPVGTPLTNSEYWAHTGNYNAQINEITNIVTKELSDFNTKIEAQNIKIDSNTQAINATNNILFNTDKGIYSYIQYADYFDTTIFTQHDTAEMWPSQGACVKDDILFVGAHLNNSKQAIYIANLATGKYISTTKFEEENNHMASLMCIPGNNNIFILCTNNKVEEREPYTGVLHSTYNLPVSLTGIYFYNGKWYGWGTSNNVIYVFSDTFQTIEKQITINNWPYNTYFQGFCINNDIIYACGSISITMYDMEGNNIGYIQQNNTAFEFESIFPYNNDIILSVNIVYNNYGSGFSLHKCVNLSPNITTTNYYSQIINAAQTDNIFNYNETLDYLEIHNPFNLAGFSYSQPIESIHFITDFHGFYLKNRNTNLYDFGDSDTPINVYTILMENNNSMISVNIRPEISSASVIDNTFTVQKPSKANTYILGNNTSQNIKFNTIARNKIYNFSTTYCLFDSNTSNVADNIIYCDSYRQAGTTIISGSNITSGSKTSDFLTNFGTFFFNNILVRNSATINAVLTTSDNSNVVGTAKLYGTVEHPSAFSGVCVPITDTDSIIYVYIDNLSIIIKSSTSTQYNLKTAWINY